MANPRKNDDGTDKLRITTQFRVRGGMAYELREHGSRLTVLITNGAPGSEWTCEAFTDPARPISHSATTRAEAVRRTSDAWRSDQQGLPRFDWDAVVSALTQVRAI